MEFLVKEGVPLRSAHEAVGKLVRTCEERRCQLRELPAESFDTIRPGLAQKVQAVLGVQQALLAMKSYGSTAPAEVEKQLQLWEKRLMGKD